MGVIKRTNPSGKKIWGIRWVDEHGRTRRQFDAAWTRSTTQTEYDKLAERLRSGVATNPDMTVADLFAEWHARHVAVNCSPAYFGDAETQFRLRIEPMIGHRTIDTVNRRIAREMVAKMQQVMRKRSPGNEYAGHATINKTLTVLKGMFSYAVEIDQLAHNPIHGVPELPVEPTRRIDAWPMPAITAVATAAAKLPERLPAFQRSQQAPWAGQRDATLILLAAMTGLRQSELLGLTWEQIDEEWIHVTHKLCRRSFVRRETKSKRGVRRVPLLASARSLLDAWRAVGAHDEIVFPNHPADDYMRASHFDTGVWHRARTTAKVVTVAGRDYDCTKMTFHELRHTFVSLCLAAGRDLWEVAHWAGDDPDMIKQVYGHYIPDSLGDTTRLNQALTATGNVKLLTVGSYSGS